MSETPVVNDCDDFEELNIIADELGSWRWGTTHDIVVKHNDKYFRSYYRVQVEEGITDCSFPMKFKEVFPHIVSTTVYKDKPQ